MTDPPHPYQPTPTQFPFRCPVCDGRGVVGYPPETPAGQAFSASKAGPWPCVSCKQSGIVWGPK